MPDAVEDFDKKRFEGNWFEIYRDRSVWYELGDHCVTATWTCREYPSWIKNYIGWFHECGVDNKRYVPEEDRINSTDKSSNALKARCPYNSGFCFVKTGIFPEGNLIILDTDYNNYSIEYSCTDYVVAHSQFAWVKSRTPRLSDNYIEHAK